MMPSKGYRDLPAQAGLLFDVVFLAVSGDFALEWAEKIAAGDDGALVIDNSSAFRYGDRYPLVVPEISADSARGRPTSLSQA